VESDHVYFRPVPPRKNFSRPAVLSEFGGYSLPVDGHRFNPKNNYGYRSFSDAKEFESALLSLYQEQILPRIEEGLSATVLTQVSDVEDETNGLVTYDRKVLKVDEKRMQEMAAKLSRAFSRRFGS